MKYFAVCHECGEMTDKEDDIRWVRKWAKAHEHEAVIYKTGSDGKWRKYLIDGVFFIVIEVAFTVVRKTIFKL